MTIDMTVSPVLPHEVGLILPPARQEAISKIVMIRRRLIWEARQRGEVMPWDSPETPPTPLNPYEKAEAGIPLTEAEVSKITEDYRIKIETERLTALAEANRKAGR